MRITAISDGGDFEGVVADDTDFDSRFLLTEDDGSRYWLNGWLFEIEVEEA